MISGNSDSSFKKLATINRRMFIFSAAKAVIFFGVGNLSGIMRNIQIQFTKGQIIL